jgi:hypothetical protein
MRLELEKFLKIFDDYHNAGRKIVPVLDYNHSVIKSVSSFREDEVIDNIEYEDIRKLISNVYRELDSLDKNHQLHSFDCQIGYNKEYSDNVDYQVDAMKPTSYGGSGIFGMRIFALNIESVMQKINIYKTPYKESLLEIANKIHPYYFTENSIVSIYNNKFNDFFYDIYNKNIDDLESHYINMDEFYKLILENININPAFQGVIQDFKFDINDNKKQLTIINDITKYKIGFRQYSETKYFCNIE